ncbi:MAG: hypothetical protein CMJ84_16995 [Planctomycetes bacterium]|nr:hypothetical protein [Planctomycetota bacterium]
MRYGYQRANYEAGDDSATPVEPGAPWPKVPWNRSSGKYPGWLVTWPAIPFEDHPELRAAQDLMRDLESERAEIVRGFLAGHRGAGRGGGSVAAAWVCRARGRRPRPPLARERERGQRVMVGGGPAGAA